MVTFITGFPGSGKSYFEIDKIYNVMSNNHDLSKSIEVIYTNINGIKIDEFPKGKIQLKKLNIEEFYKYLEESYLIYDSYKNADNVDELLIDHSKKKGFHNCLIAFDECHDFLSNQDKIKVYWLTYHRHLHHEIDLLTQNKGLINSKYRAIPEIFIEAQARSKKFFSNTLSYKHFASFAMRKGDLFNKSSIKTKKEVFELYQSGNTSKQKSILTKFIYIIILALIFVSIILYFLFQNLSKHSKDQEVEEEKIVKVIVDPKKNIDTPISNENIIIEDSDNYVLKVVFDSREGYYIHNEYYSIIHFKKFLSKTQSKVLSKFNLISNRNYKLSNLYIRTNDEALKRFFILPKAKTDPADTNDIKINF